MRVSKRRERKDDRIQDGIYFRSKEIAGPCWRLLLLNFHRRTPKAEARRALKSLWRMLGDLGGGVPRDLKSIAPAETPEAKVPSGNLTSMLAIGRRLFDSKFHRPALADDRQRPEELTYLLPQGKGTPFPSLNWAEDERRKLGEADIAFQFIADTQTAVNRAAVEVWKLIVDDDLPLTIVGLHEGFGRDDGRSWIDFHDGVNNIESSQRLTAIEVRDRHPRWMERGTYMAFLRVAVDLELWRTLDRARQEALVGRDKLTGCPIDGIDVAGNKLKIDVLDGRPALKPPGSSEYRDPGQGSDARVEASHIHRSNQNRGAPDTDANNRVFRQGFEFVEPLETGAFELGLNFVSFQRRLSLLTQGILRQKGWLGDVNFGGVRKARSPLPRPIRLMKVVSGGLYAVPPDARPFPGASLFQS